MVAEALKKARVLIVATIPMTPSIHCNSDAGPADGWWRRLELGKNAPFWARCDKIGVWRRAEALTVIGLFAG